jgi:GxxExxY protein
MTNNEITRKIIGLAIKIHQTLGPGLLESVYQQCLVYELRNANIKVEKEVLVPITYENMKFETGFRMDLLVENKIVIELKAVENIHEKHISQVLTYLKLSNNKIGLLINFNEKYLKDGIKRIIID